MGADPFLDVVGATKGQSVGDVFRKAVEASAWENGHGGYTGSLAEKDSFQPVSPVPGKNAWDTADDMTDDEFGDKWGPAGMIELNKEELVKFWGDHPGLKEQYDRIFLIFGWASS